MHACHCRDCQRLTGSAVRAEPLDRAEVRGPVRCRAADRKADAGQRRGPRRRLLRRVQHGAVEPLSRAARVTHCSCAEQPSTSPDGTHPTCTSSRGPSCPGSRCPRARARSPRCTPTSRRSGRPRSRALPPPRRGAQGRVRLNCRFDAEHYRAAARPVSATDYRCSAEPAERRTSSGTRLHDLLRAPGSFGHRDARQVVRARGRLGARWAIPATSTCARTITPRAVTSACRSRSRPSSSRRSAAARALWRAGGVPPLPELVVLGELAQATAERAPTSGSTRWGSGSRRAASSCSPA